MDAWVPVKRDTLATVLRYLCESEDVNAIREEDGSDEADAHRRNCEAARELEDRVERGTVADVSVDGALRTLIEDVKRAND
jgi:hypothetical protein